MATVPGITVPEVLVSLLVVVGEIVVGPGQQNSENCKYEEC